MNVAEYYNPETGFSNEPSFCDWCLGQAIQALVDDGQEETAVLFLTCELTWNTRRYTGLSGMWYSIDHSPIIIGPISVVKDLRQQPGTNDHGDDCMVDSHHLTAFDEMLRLVLGNRFGRPTYEFQVKSVTLPTNWREELLEIARKKGTTNQGRRFDNDARSLIYANLRFRSEPEIRVAKALDKAGVMYYANCTARVNSGGDRVNREPDFLICHNGRWGIIEVDGKAFHPPLRKAQEDGRDRLFKHHGVSCIEHYPAEQCLQEPAEVVASFLALLAMNG